MAVVGHSQWTAPTHLDDIGYKCHHVIELAHVHVEMMKVIPESLVGYDAASLPDGV